MPKQTTEMESTVDFMEALKRGPEARHNEHERQQRTRRMAVDAKDTRELEKQGKRPQLRRMFSFTSMLGFTTTMLVTWEGGLFTNVYALESGGPVALVYGFVYCTFGTLAAAASLAELVSIAPTSGGQYHWVSILAPKKRRYFLSWLTGWLSTIGWQVSVTSGFYLAAAATQGIAAFNNPSYDPKGWHVTFLIWAFEVLGVFVNTLTARVLPSLEGFILICHVLGFFGILIPMVYLTDPQPSSFVFGAYIPQSGWSSGGVNFFIGLLSGLYPYVGYDGPCHMAEEVRDATRVVPWALITAIILNGALGFCMMIAFLYCIENYTNALAGRSGYPFIEVFYEATFSSGGTTAMTALLIYMVVTASIGLMASSSRMTWAFARDRGLPFSKFFSKVDSSSLIPLNAIFLTAVIAGLLALIIIGSSVAFNIIVSVVIACLNTSYAIPIALVLHKRLTVPHFAHGPWWMGTYWGAAVNVFALVYLFLTTLFSFFPPNYPVTPVNMNYSCVVFGAVVLGGCLYWRYDAKKHYRGPVIEVEVSVQDEGEIELR